ncbi:DUF4227 family protein [Ferviditalea candida]|uniref:DUF4227 family protein n=1 Tax=Ferviditalea candida TaxID=3108399 RepID=A0ABU5ZLL7_9BACL|nr:DUF4227 family protein [Paenibacillaceae bacterium T2]
MIFSLQKWLKRAKFILLFLVMTVMLHHFSVWISAWMDPVYRYKTPSNRAVKAFKDGSGWDGSSLADRLIFYYWYGE